MCVGRERGVVDSWWWREDHRVYARRRSEWRAEGRRQEAVEEGCRRPVHSLRREEAPCHRVGSRELPLTSECACSRWSAHTLRRASCWRASIPRSAEISRDQPRFPSVGVGAPLRRSLSEQWRKGAAEVPWSSVGVISAVHSAAGAGIAIFGPNSVSFGVRLVHRCPDASGICQRACLPSATCCAKPRGVSWPGAQSPCRPGSVFGSRGR